MWHTKTIIRSEPQFNVEKQNWNNKTTKIRTSDPKKLETLPEVLFHFCAQNKISIGLIFVYLCLSMNQIKLIRLILIF